MALTSASAFAQEAATTEQGLGPYRFGMNSADLRATAPNADWASRNHDGGVIISGGPQVEVGAPLDASFVFASDQLRRIVLAGVVSGACPNAVSLMVGAMEPTYGAFTSVAPPSLELGAVKRVLHTQGGSEVRIREIDRARADEAVSARYGESYVLVHGRPQGERCQLTLTFGPATDWVRSERAGGPTWAQLEAAQTLSDPRWARRPNAYSFTRAYPQRALDEVIDGTVVLDCLVLADGSLSCLAVDETPVGEGFATAALQIARDYRVRRGRDGESAIGRRVRVPINFNAESP